MAPFAGYDMPIQYPGGMLAEHLHTRARRGSSTSRIWDRRCSKAPITRACGLSRNAVPRGLRQSRAGTSALHAIAQRERRDCRRSDDHASARRRRGAEARRQRSRKAVDFALLRERCPKGLRLTPLGEAALIALQGPLAAATLARLAPGEGLEAAPFMSARPARSAGSRPSFPDPAIPARTDTRSPFPQRGPTRSRGCC